MEDKLAKQNEEEREEFRQERTALFQERWEKQNEVFKLEQQADLPELVRMPFEAMRALCSLIPDLGYSKPHGSETLASAGWPSSSRLILRFSLCRHVQTPCA